MRARPFACGFAVLALLAALVAGSTVSAGSERPVHASAADPTHLPLGDGQISTTTAQRGKVLSCQTTFRTPTGRVAKNPPWIRTDGTWDSTVKASVAGAVTWSRATYKAKARKGVRRITSLNLPFHH